MSKGNIFQGQATGKLGDTVLMVRNGKQVARVYTMAGARSGKDASEAARIQRVKFGSASNQWNLYKYVCTRLFRKGRKTTQSDYNYFVKRNNLLFPYLTKSENADGVHVLMPGQFSEGNLGRIELVHVVKEAPQIDTPVLYVRDINAYDAPSVYWGGTMLSLKSALQVAYPAARKVTYLVSLPSSVSIEEEGVSFVSQFVTHWPIIIDLYSESTPGENADTVAAYVKARISNESIRAVIDLQTTYNFISGKAQFRFGMFTGMDTSTIQNLAILVFATDDNASDCYTTLLQDTSVPSTYGPYAVWAGYRSKSSLRVAADSYGYQSGVMRDDIASVGDDLSEQMQLYISKVRSFDKDAALSIEKSVKSAGTAAKVVRTAVAKDEKSE